MQTYTDHEAIGTTFPRFTLADGTRYDVTAHGATEIQHVVRLDEFPGLDFVVITRRANGTRDWQSFDLYKARRSHRTRGDVEYIAAGYIADGVARLDRRPGMGYREEIGGHPPVDGYRAAIRACVRFIRQDRTDY